MARSAPPAALVLALAALLAAPLAAHSVQHTDIIYHLSDEEYYEMPELFSLEDQERCGARGGAYCLGSFELADAGAGAEPNRQHRLLQRIQRYSANWVDNFNHSRLHRGLCLSTACAPAPPNASLHQWFAWCVNASTVRLYNASARLLDGAQCGAGAGAAPLAAPLDAAERAFAAAAAALLALAALSTTLDLTLADHAKKGLGWALAWSVRGSWRELQAAGARGGTGTGISTGTGTGISTGTGTGTASSDLRALDGLRVFCMMCVVIEHVCWLATQHYVANTREYELMRRAWDAMLMVNSTLVVQIFFLMSSFLLAHKLLATARGGAGGASARSDLATFADTMLNRIIRVSPSYWLVVWFAACGWGRVGSGPLWGPLVGKEVDVCRRKWWTHLLYLNNVIYPDDKCLIQTWYLAADMQLYALALALTLALRRGQKPRALAVLAALLAATLAALAALAYAWRLVPTYAMHNPELVRRVYSGESSFNVLYQSPLANAPGALAGLLLAFAHHHLSHSPSHARLHDNKAFRWSCAWAPYLAFAWAALAPLTLGDGPPPRAGAAALAALERPVFAAFVSLGLLGAMHHVRSPLRAVLSWRGWAVPARLSFGVLLLHMPLNKSLVAARATAVVINRKTIVVEWLGVALWSYALALPLALLVELPALRLWRSLARTRAGAGAQPSPSQPIRASSTDKR